GLTSASSATDRRLAVHLRSQPANPQPRRTRTRHIRRKPTARLPAQASEPEHRVQFDRRRRAARVTRALTRPAAPDVPSPSGAAGPRLLAAVRPLVVALRRRRWRLPRNACRGFGIRERELALELL